VTFAPKSDHFVDFAEKFALLTSTTTTTSTHPTTTKRRQPQLQLSKTEHQQPHGAKQRYIFFNNFLLLYYFKSRVSTCTEWTATTRNSHYQHHQATTSHQGLYDGITTNSTGMDMRGTQRKTSARDIVDSLMTLQVSFYFIFIFYGSFNTFISGKTATSLPWPLPPIMYGKGCKFMQQLKKHCCQSRCVLFCLKFY
jgi:hypothetical protein